MNILASYIVHSDGWLGLVIWGVCIALIIYVLFWGLGKVALGEPMNKILTIIIVLIAVVMAIDFILAVRDYAMDGRGLGGSGVEIRTTR